MKPETMKQLSKVAVLIREKGHLDMVEICKELQVMPSTAYSYIQVLPSFFEDIEWRDGKLCLKQ